MIEQYMYKYLYTINGGIEFSPSIIELFDTSLELEDDMRERALDSATLHCFAYQIIPATLTLEEPAAINKIRIEPYTDKNIRAEDNFVKVSLKSNCNAQVHFLGDYYYTKQTVEIYTSPAGFTKDEVVIK